MRLFLPELAEVDHLLVPEGSVGDLSLMDQEPRVDFSPVDRPHDRVERHINVPDTFCESFEQQSGGRQGTGGADGLPAQFAERPVQAGDQYGSVPFPHAGARPHDPVPVGDGAESVCGDGGHLQLGPDRPLVEGLYVFEQVFNQDAGELHFAAGEPVKHEGIVRIRTVSHSDCAVCHLFSFL